MGSFKQFLVLAAVSLVIAGCGKEANPGWDQPLEPEGPVMMEHGLVYLDRAFDEIVVLRTGSEAELTVERRPTGAEPEQMAVSADGESLYVINRGDQTLSVFDIGEGSMGQSTVDVGNVYDRITVDPHGDFLLLSNSGEADDAVIQNVNEVGVVDLRSGVPDEIDVVTLPVQADRLELMDPFQLEGQDQRVAVALATNRVTILDLYETQQRNRVRQAPLTASQVDEIEPERVVFDPPTLARPNRASLFVLDSRGDDVTQIAMQLSQGGEQARKFDLSINQLAAGNHPSDVALLELDGEGESTVNRLLAFDAQQPRFTLVDVDSGESATFDLPMSSPVDGMKIYRVFVPGEEGTEKRVLAYSHNDSLVAVIRPDQIAVGSETPTLGQAVQELRLQARPHRVIMGEGTEGERAVVLHAGGDDGLSLIDLDTNTNWWLRGHNPSDIVFDSTAAYAIFNNTAHMARIDLNTGGSRDFELPDRGRALHLSPDKESVLVRHDGASGRFTVLDRATLAPEDARLYEHVFLGGALDYEAIDKDD